MEYSTQSVLTVGMTDIEFFIRPLRVCRLGGTMISLEISALFVRGFYVFYSRLMGSGLLETKYASFVSTDGMN